VEEPKSSLNATLFRLASNTARTGFNIPEKAIIENIYVISTSREILKRSMSLINCIDPFVAAPPIVTIPVVFVEFGKSSAISVLIFPMILYKPVLDPTLLACR
jgi:hypothetical protein